MNTLEQRIRSFEQDQQRASDYVDALAAAEPDMSAVELEDAYYAELFKTAQPEVPGTSYFTSKFMNLAPERKVEEIATMLLRVLYNADADTDANIAVVDAVTDLRSIVAKNKIEA